MGILKVINEYFSESYDRYLKDEQKNSILHPNFGTCDLVENTCEVALDFVEEGLENMNDPENPFAEFWKNEAYHLGANVCNKDVIMQVVFYKNKPKYCWI